MIAQQLQPVIVRAGDGEEQSAFGVTTKALTTGAQSDGKWLVLEYVAPPGFAGPPPHIHKVMTEIFYVLDGVLTMGVDGQVAHLSRGGCAYVPPGVVHRFSNETAEPVTFLVVTSPAGFEHYFAELRELIKHEPSWPPKDMSKLVALMAKYDIFPAPQGDEGPELPN